MRVGLLLILVSLFACNSKDPLKIVKVVELGGTRVSDTTLVSVLQNEKNLMLDLEFSSNAEKTISQLINREIDLAIIPNNIRLTPGGKELRTVTPLLPRMLMVFHKNDYQPTIAELFAGATVSYELTGESDSAFFETFVEHYAIPSNSYNYFRFRGTAHYSEIKQQLDSADVWLSISHVHNYLIDSLFEYDYQLYPLDEEYEGNSLDGFSMKYPTSYPMIIPKYLYDGNPTQRIPTVGIRDILVSHKDLNPSTVYDIAEVLAEKRNFLVQQDRNYSLMANLDDEKYSLSFPLHRGTRSYLNREKPTFIERYAEVMALIFSIIVLAGGYLTEKVQDFRERVKKGKKAT